MNKIQISREDAIVAISTPNGMGAIGMIRISGTHSFEILKQISKKADVSGKERGKYLFTKLYDNDELIDEGIVLIYPLPRSYTGEDMVEICCHGSPYIMSRLLEICVRLGARQASSGEFSMRAYLNGKLDLAQAEAVCDLIQSNNKTAHNSALKNIKGQLSSEIQKFKDSLKELIALLELELDFSDEDVEFASRDKIHETLEGLKKYCEKLVKSFKYGNAIKDGFAIALIGEPNVGKSSLLNYILNEDRAIISNIPGTTRDVIEETFIINDILFRFIDTAGLRKAENEIEKLGIEKSFQMARKADMILLLCDAEQGVTNNIRDNLSKLKPYANKIILVANKIDKLNDEQNQHLEKAFRKITPNVFLISVLKKQNIESLKHFLSQQALGEEFAKEDTILTNLRHKHCLEKVLQSIQESQQAIAQKLPSDLVVVHLKDCLNQMSEITGETTHEDILDIIFSKFCIGK